MIAHNPYRQASAKVAGDHGSSLRKDSPAVADAIREIAAAHDLEVR